MPMIELYLVNHDLEKDAIVIGYVSELNEMAPPRILTNAINALLDIVDIDASMVNVIPFPIFGLSLDQQQAIISFMANNPDHNVVKEFIDLHNKTKEEHASLAETLDSVHRHVTSLIDELLIDSVLEQVNQ